MDKIKTILALIAINFLVSGKALSQSEITTISSILDNPVEGQEVILRGKILNQQPGETDYIFTDGTNQITIEIEDQDFSYSSDTTIEISGIVNFESEHPEEVEKDPTPEELEINVNQFRVINP